MTRLLGSATFRLADSILAINPKSPAPVLFIEVTYAMWTRESDVPVASFALERASDVCSSDTE
jgi:hypothetical protein